MTRINNALREKILSVMAGESLTAAQICSRIPLSIAHDIQSDLIGMRNAGLVKRTIPSIDEVKGYYKPALWSRV